MDKAALDVLFETYDWWMGFSTIVVAVGILGELILPFIFEREKKPIAEIVLSVFFGAIVFGGVLGEYQVGTRLSGVARQRRDLTDKEVVDARLEQERLRTENLDLQRRIQPRELTTEQREAIGRSCQQFAGQQVVLYSYSLDVEGAFFSQ
jgi:hypothetical protein